MRTSPGCVQQLIRELAADRDSIIDHLGIGQLAKMSDKSSKMIH
ncbi:hypothetical protein [Laspinema palackyanum]